MKRKNNFSLSHGVGAIGSSLGKGIIAGAVGTLAITLSQMIEMRINDRKPSTMPAKVATKVLDIKAINVQHKEQFSQEVHWAYGTTWGIPRGLMTLIGIKGWPATLLHFASIYATALIMPPALKAAPPVNEWGAKAIAIDALHHAVYAAATGLVYDAIEGTDED